MTLVLLSCTSPGPDVRAPSPSASPGSPSASARSSERRGDASGFLVTVGDIACAPGTPKTRVECHHAGTAALLERGGPLGGDDLAAVLLLGDIQYEQGTREEYRSFDQTWGRVLARTRARVLPVTGNHEYLNEGIPPPGCDLITGDRQACGFWAYFARSTDLLDDGDAQYVVSFGDDDAHPLVVIVLDVGRCEFVPETCGPQGPVVRYLSGVLADPAVNPPEACTVVAWHQARWSELGHGDLSFVDPVWRALFRTPPDRRPDLVLNGHDHVYQRFPPLGPNGEPDRTGIVEIVVGTGGRSIAGLPWAIPTPGELEAIDASSFGVLRVDRDGDRAALTTAFVTERGQTRDRAVHHCRG